MIQVCSAIRNMLSENGKHCKCWWELHSALSFQKCREFILEYKYHLLLTWGVDSITNLESIAILLLETEDISSVCKTFVPLGVWVFLTWVKPVFCSHCRQESLLNLWSQLTIFVSSADNVLLSYTVLVNSAAQHFWVASSWRIPLHMYHSVHQSVVNGYGALL